MSNAAKKSSSEPVWLVFTSHAGPRSEFPQEGSHTLFRLDGDPLVLHQGLNPPMDAAEWAAWEKIPAIKSMLDARQLEVVDASLGHHCKGPAAMDLAKRTSAAEAIEHMLELEMAKPVSGRIGERRDQELIDLLRRRLEVATRRRVVSLAGITGEAKQAAEHLGARAK